MSVRVAVVTGSNKGIGLAIVRSLCSQFQGDVYLTSRDEGRGKAAVDSLTSEGLNPKFQQLDIDDLNSIIAAAAFFKETYGGVDVLINNAGIAFGKDSTPFPVQAELTLKTNFFSTRNVLTHFLPLVRPGGRVVNVSSTLGSRALRSCSASLQERFRSEDIGEEELDGLMQQFVDLAQKDQHREAGWPESAYAVSKTGLTTLSMILARRLSKERPNDEILLNACCPGWVHTDMTDSRAPRSPAEGAVTPLHLAMLPRGAAKPHGKFVYDKEVQPW